MKYTVNDIIKRYNTEKHLKYVFFWGHTVPAWQTWEVTKACLSQWYDCRFQSDGITYYTAEQYMMAQKALLFQDTEIYDEIMAAGHPKQFKKLGRKIRHFDEKIWNEHKYEIVVRGNLEKFSQNQQLRDFLLGTNTRILVEASPCDRIWGIGMSAEDKNIENPAYWKGENLLGFALMEVRDSLLEK